MKFSVGSVSVLLLAGCATAFNLIQPKRFSARSTLKNAARGDSPTALSMGLTIYGHPGTRSPLVNWGATELGLDFSMGDLSKNPHPFGQIPCVTDDDDVLVFESGAILQYFHSLTKDDLLSKSEAASVTSWITWANASLDPICFLETPEGKVYDTGLKKPNKRIDKLNDILSSQKFLVSDEKFTLADVAVASYLLYVIQFFPGIDISRWPDVVRYMKDCASRPGYGAAFGDKTQAYLLSQLGEQKPKKMFGVF